MMANISIVTLTFIFLAGIYNQNLSTLIVPEAQFSRHDNYGYAKHPDLFRTDYLDKKVSRPIQEQESSVGTFYYPWWWGKSEGYQGWKVDNHNPPTTWRSMYLPDMVPKEFDPTKELYSVTDPAVVKKQLGWMKDAGIQFAIASWFGPSEDQSSSDYAFRNILHKIMPEPDNPHPKMKWTILYEDEGVSDPSVEVLIEDLNYIKSTYSSSPYYLRIDGKPVIFVYNTIGSDRDPLDDLERWIQVREETGFYVVMRDDPISEGEANPNSMDGWYRYKPGLSFDQVGSFSASVSPGYWAYHDSNPTLKRNPADFENAVEKLAAAEVRFKLILTWNEWKEGTGIEPAQQIIHDDKDGFVPATNSYALTYIDILGKYLRGDPGIPSTTLLSLKDDDFNIAAAADWTCSSDAQKTADHIRSNDPEIVLVPGDLSYNKRSGSCWYEIIEPFKSETKIAIGNHDDEESGSKELKDDYLNHFNLTRSYYSFDYRNIHTIVMDTQVDYSKNSLQYNFVKADLEVASKDALIDWVFVQFHKPMYSSSPAHLAQGDFGNIYHPLFDMHGVDIVIQGHHHSYERTFPINFNHKDPSEPIVSIIDKGIRGNHYKDPPGPIFVTVGTAGATLDRETPKPDYFAYRDNNNHGFLNMEISEQNKMMSARFYSNESDNQLADQFIISK
jgi:hypothetical protein